MIIIGGLITISTLMLHQHNIADVLLTYTLGIIFFIVDMYFGLFIKIENFLNKLFRIKNVK
ncbi:hypothetical protein FACS189459_2240 [Bacilli bacterium]|nr:hypothetical protein FACS189459_2240 [Bacilli bacterium]